MKPNRMLLTAASAIFSVQVMAGQAVFYVTEDGSAVRDLAVSVDGKKKLVSSSGFVAFDDIEGGKHTVELSKYGEWMGEFDFSTAGSKQNAEIQVEMIAGEAMPEINVYTPGSEEVAVLGQLTGTLQSEETGGPVAGARVSINGTETAVMTDEDGKFSFELPRGEYSLTIKHPNYGERDIKDVRVMGNISTGMNLTMSMSGDGMIEEVVAVGSYIPSTAVAQQRDASGVLDAIGSEQFSRFGDSDAASALKRVTGVTVSGGKYAVVRGLNERYTSVLFNGAMLPSPDSTRRVVPLDIFPSSVISSLNVEKTGSAARPVDSAGATINVISREAPEEFEGKFSLNLEYADGTTGESVRTQKKSGMEILGFADSKRDLTSSAKSLANAARGTALTGSDGASVADLGNWETEDTDIPVSFGMEGSIGNLIGDYDFGRLSYKATARYSNKWDYQETDRANYKAISASEIGEQDEYIESRAINNIDLSGALTLSLMGDAYSATSNTMVLRNTQNEANESVGVRGEDRYFTVERDYNWQERQFVMQQFVGDFQFPETLDANIEWGLTYAKAELDAPDALSYTLRDSVGGISEDNSFNPLADNRSDDLDLLVTSRPQRDFTYLDDDSLDLQLKGDIAAIQDDSYQVRVAAGFETLDRSRTVDAYSFTYQLAGNGFILPSQYRGETDISNIINSSSFADGDFEVRSLTDAEASYDGDWTYSSYFLMPSVELYDIGRLEVGVRYEDSDLSIKTSVDPDTGTRVSAKVEDDDFYPTLSLNITAIENWQFRFAYYESINRPDFREVAPAIFKDTVSGETYEGNPDLEQAYVDNYDLRAEYYFSDAESVSLGLFRKDIDKAIERSGTIVSGSSNDIIYSFQNNGDAYTQGVEFSAAKDFELGAFGLRLSGNASYFETQIDVYNYNGVRVEQRDLQGQPDILGNLQVAVDEYNSGREYTLVINHTGESLYSVSADDSLENEKLLARTVVDFNFKQPFTENLVLKASLDNLLDTEVKQEQGGRMTKRYSPGRAVSLGVSMDF